jgi:hypothetical protein
MDSLVEYLAAAVTTAFALIAAAYSLRRRVGLWTVGMSDRIGALLSGICAGVGVATPTVWFIHFWTAPAFGGIFEDRSPLVDALMHWWPVVAWAAGAVAVGREVARAVVSGCAPTGAAAP